MDSRTELITRAAAHSRAAKNLLAEKGAARWTAQDQATFDTHVNEAERLQQQISAMPAWSADPAGIKAIYRDGFDIFLRKAPAQFTDEEARKVKASMSTGVGSEGGYLVGTPVAGDIVSQLRGYGFIRAVARSFTTMKGEAMGYPTSDGREEVGEQLDQNEPADESDADFGTRSLPVYTYSSKLFTVPVQLLQDSSVDMIGFVAGRVVERIGRIQNLAFTMGSGVNEPLGLVPAAAVGKVGAAGQTAAVTYDDLVDLQESVDAAHHGMPTANAPGNTSAGWMMSQSTRKFIRKLRDDSGRPLWNPGVIDPATGRQSLPMLLDHPVHLNNDFPAMGADAKSIAFGDFGKYAVRDVVSVQLYRFDDSRFALKGQVGFLGLMRSGGNLLDLGAVKVYQHPAA